MQRIQLSFLTAVFTLAAASGQAGSAERGALLKTGVGECKRLYDAANLKTCVAQVKEIVWTIQNPPRSAAKRLIQPNALYGLPY